MDIKTKLFFSWSNFYELKEYKGIKKTKGLVFKFIVHKFKSNFTFESKFWLHKFPLHYSKYIDSILGLSRSLKV